MSEKAEKRKAQRDFVELSSRPAFVLHYANTGFQEEGTPRVTVACVKDMNGQTKTFSVALNAELKKIPLDEVHSRFDELEEKLLKDLFDYASKRPNGLWVGWKLRDSRFGLEALENRYEALTGQRRQFPANNRLELSDYLWKVGGEYADHPRMLNLAKLNDLTTTSLLAGKEEPEAFHDGHYGQLTQSVLRKTEMIASFYQLTKASKLKIKDGVISSPGSLLSRAWKIGLGVATIIGAITGVFGLTQCGK